MTHLIRERMELRVLEDGFVFLAIDIQIDEMNIRCVNRRFQISCGYGKVVLFFATIEHCGYFTLVAQLFRISFPYVLS